MVVVIFAHEDEERITGLNVIAQIQIKNTGRVNMRKKHTGKIFSAIDSIRNDQSGITGLETAIVLIAFIIVAAVFAFAVLTTGLFTTERAKETSMAGVGEAQATLAQKGAVLGEAATSTVQRVKFKLANASGAQAVDLASNTTLLTYADPNNNVNAGFNANAGDAGACAAAGQVVCWKSFWVIGTGDTVNAGEIVELTIDLTNLDTPLSNNTGFKIEVIPNRGAVVPVSRTTPLEISPVMVLD